jgi:hypothetical protein
MRADVLIRVDWMAGALAGVLMLGLRGWLADLYALPADLLLVIGVANCAYACVSFTLFMRRREGRVPFLRVIAAANILWASVCVGLAVTWFAQASVFGMGQLIGEAVLVGGLGVLEWRAAVS